MTQALACESQSAKQGDKVQNESLELGRFSCLELARMRIPGFPTTEQGWGKVVAREQWPWVEVQAKGGKRGVKRVYTPPAALLEAIRRHKEGVEVTPEEVAAARAARPRSSQPLWTLDEQGRYAAQVAAHHDMGKAHPAMAEAVGRARGGLVVSLPADAGKTKSMTRLMAQALSAGFTRAIFLVDASQAELLMLGNSTIARLEEESARRQLELDALVGDPEILDAALRLEWLLMQREPMTSPVSQS